MKCKQCKLFWYCDAVSPISTHMALAPILILNTRNVRVLAGRKVIREIASS